MYRIKDNIIKVRNIMKELQLSAVILTDRYNVNYLSGYMGDTGYLLLTEDREYILTDSRYTEQVTKEAPDFSCIDIGMDGYAKTVWKLLEDTESGSEKEKHSGGEGRSSEIKGKSIELSKSRIGFENEDISYKQYKGFVDKLSSCELVPLDGRISAMRQIKTPEEVEKIATAEAIGDKAFAHILDFIKLGMSEKEIALELEYTMKKLGADGLSFDTIAASGNNSSLPHAVPTERKLTDGDFLTMDFGCVYEGYCSDMTRTVFIGNEPSVEQKKVYDTVLLAQTEAMKLIRPGAKCSDVDACARKIIADAGYGEFFGHGLGHSVGLFIHEEPRLSRKCDDILQPGIIMTVEPGIYLPGKFGVRIEDLVVVTEDGYRNLTSSPKSLICI